MPVTAANAGAAPLFMQIGGVQGSTSINQHVISWSDDKGTIFPGTGTASTVYSSLTGLFSTGQPTNPDTYAVARGKSVIDCRARRPEPPLQHQHERVGQAEAEDVDRAAPLRGRHGHAGRRQLQHDHRADARSDGERASGGNITKTANTSWISPCCRLSATATASSS